MNTTAFKQTGKNVAKFLGASVLGVQLVACAGLQSTQSQSSSYNDNIAMSSCTVPTTLITATAFDESKQTLGSANCHYRFEAIFDQLKIVGSGNPGSHNTKYFASFINWSKKEGIITSKQATHLYNSYFGNVFVSLPNHGNICSHTAYDNSLQPMLDSELALKREGLVDILGNSKSFNGVYDQYEQLSFVLDMAQQACQS
jgi:hypothetical protein